MEALPGFLIAALALAGSPGPATLSLAAAGAAFGARRGLAYLVGLVAGMVVVMGIVASGVVGLLLAVPGAMPVVTALATLYFVWLAWRIATAPPLAEEEPERSPPIFVAGVLLSLINPKGYAAMAALYSGFALVPGQVVLDATVKLAGLTIVIAVVNTGWLLVGATLTRLFRHPRSNRTVNVVFAVLLLGSVLVLPFCGVTR